MSINITTPTEASQEAMEAKTLAVPPVERGGEGGSTVVVTPILTSGTHIADITVDDETKELYAPASESELPSGGDAGQVLEKYGTGDGEVYWADKRAVPTGGTSGQILRNYGDGNYAWGDVIKSTLRGSKIGEIAGTSFYSGAPQIIIGLLNVTFSTSDISLTSASDLERLLAIDLNYDITSSTSYIILLHLLDSNYNSILVPAILNYSPYNDLSQASYSITAETHQYYINITFTVTNGVAVDISNVSSVDVSISNWT